MHLPVHLLASLWRRIQSQWLAEVCMERTVVYLSRSGMM